MSGRNREAKSIGDDQLSALAGNGHLVPFPLLLPSPTERRETRQRNQVLRRGSQGYQDPQKCRTWRNAWRDKISTITAQRFYNEVTKMKTISQLIELLGDVGFVIAVVLTLAPTVKTLLAGLVK